MKRAGMVFYYEVDLAGNVRRLRDPNGADLGGYRYTAFGQAYPADAGTPAPAIQQPLEWKARWFSSLAGGIYDVRARQWAPGMGAFTAVDEFEMHGNNSTLWGWPNQNPLRFLDPTGHDADQCKVCPDWDPHCGQCWAGKQACEETCAKEAKILFEDCMQQTGNRPACEIAQESREATCKQGCQGCGP